MDKGTIVRTIVLVIALTNQILAMTGRVPLELSEEMIYQLVTSVVTVGATVWAWWKNNNFTLESKQAQEVLNELKGK